MPCASASVSGPPDAVLSGWETGPLRPTLGEGAVHVWRTDTRRLVGEAGGADGICPMLAPEERARAEQIQHLERRLQWMASRAVLRALLARYLGIDPSGLRIASGTFGKPALGGDPSVSFNLSHSGELMLCAFAPSGAIGVDIEVARRAIDHVAVARRAFGAGEARRLGRLDGQRREREFLRLWTRHEAALKCRGTGFGVDRSSACRSQASTRTRGSNVTWIAEIDLGTSAAGALASELPPSSVQLWETAGAW